MRKISKLLCLSMIGVTLNAMPSSYGKCVGCHGVKGERGFASAPDKVPNKLTVEEVKTALKGYKDGSYGGMQKMLMIGQARGLSDSQINEIANYIGKKSANTKTAVNKTSDLVVNRTNDAFNTNIKVSLESYIKSLKISDIMDNSLTYITFNDIFNKLKNLEVKKNVENGLNVISYSGIPNIDDMKNIEMRFVFDENNNHILTLFVSKERLLQYNFTYTVSPNKSDTKCSGYGCANHFVKRFMEINDSTLNLFTGDEQKDIKSLFNATNIKRFPKEEYGVTKKVKTWMSANEYCIKKNMGLPNIEDMKKHKNHFMNYAKSIGKKSISVFVGDARKMSVGLRKDWSGIKVDINKNTNHRIDYLFCKQVSDKEKKLAKENLIKEQALIDSVKVNTALEYWQRIVASRSDKERANLKRYNDANMISFGQYGLSIDLYKSIETGRHYLASKPLEYINAWSETSNNIYKSAFKLTNSDHRSIQKGFSNMNSYLTHKGLNQFIDRLVKSPMFKALSNVKEYNDPNGYYKKITGEFKDKKGEKHIVYLYLTKRYHTYSIDYDIKIKY